MTSFFDKIFTRYPIKTRRALELVPGLVSWTLTFSPIWGSLFFPLALAYFILFFDVYWFYKSFSLAITAFIAAKKIRAAEQHDWLKSAKANKNFRKVTHVIVIPNYKESMNKLQESIASIARQTFPTKQIYVVLGMEERESTAQEKATILIDEFKKKFGGIFATYHPDVTGEVKGKSSNQAFAGKRAYTMLVEKGIDIDFATISSVDADSIFDPQYFAYLTHKFLTDKSHIINFGNLQM